MNYDHWPEPLSGPLPECFASLEEAFEAYAEAQNGGFDGNYNDFLDMERERIADEYAVKDFERAAERLLKRGRAPTLRRLCACWMDMAS
jgi:hypothetical protein